MQGLTRRCVHAVLYEAVAVLLTTAGLLLMSEHGLASSGGLALATSAVALAWNAAFNSLFERWEARQPRRGRSLARRLAHAIGFEGGLVLLLVPLIAWWLQIGLWQALLMDLGLLLFFLVYTVAFNWAFDALFGLPASATQAVAGTGTGLHPGRTDSGRCSRLNPPASAPAPAPGPETAPAGTARQTARS